MINNSEKPDGWVAYLCHFGSVQSPYKIISRQTVTVEDIAELEVYLLIPYSILCAYLLRQLLVTYPVIKRLELRKCNQRDPWYLESSANFHKILEFIQKTGITIFLFDSFMVIWKNSMVTEVNEIYVGY